MATLLKVLNNLADIKSAGGVALRVRTQGRRRREAILEREAALRPFVGDRLAEGWTPEQISGWLKSGNEPRLRHFGRVGALFNVD